MQNQQNPPSIPILGTQAKLMVHLKRFDFEDKNSKPTNLGWVEQDNYLKIQIILQNNLSLIFANMSPKALFTHMLHMKARNVLKLLQNQMQIFTSIVKSYDMCFQSSQHAVGLYTCKLGPVKKNFINRNLCWKWSIVKYICTNQRSNLLFSSSALLRQTFFLISNRTSSLFIVCSLHVPVWCKKCRVPPSKSTDLVPPLPWR